MWNQGMRGRRGMKSNLDSTNNTDSSVLACDGSPECAHAGVRLS